MSELPSESEFEKHIEQVIERIHKVLDQIKELEQLENELDRIILGQQRTNRKDDGTATDQD
jgi:hypothetical protein